MSQEFYTGVVTASATTLPTPAPPRCVQLLDQWAVGDPALLMGVCNAHPPRDCAALIRCEPPTCRQESGQGCISAATAGLPNRAAPGRGVGLASQRHPGRLAGSPRLSLRSRPGGSPSGSGQWGPASLSPWLNFNPHPRAVLKPRAAQ